MNDWADAPRVPAGELASLVGRSFVSRWVVVDQERIDAFAEVTEDGQFIHVDPERAAATQFGGTVAHGFLTLSLLSTLAYSILPRIEGAAHGVNYGFDRVRFVRPVRSGSRVRGHFTLLAVKRRVRARMAIDLRGQRGGRRREQARARGAMADHAGDGRGLRKLRARVLAFDCIEEGRHLGS